MNIKDCKIGTYLELKGKTQKGKNRVRELGAEWVVFSTAKSVQCFASCISGPFAMIAPRFSQNRECDFVMKSRWVSLGGHDPDFTITVIGNNDEL